MSIENVERQEYVLVGGGLHGRQENGVLVVYRKGDSIQLTAKEAAKLGAERVQMAVGVAIAKSLAVTDEDTAAEWSFLDDLHHVKAVEFVRGLDDPEQVQSALDYELAHKNRPSVTFAAKDRIKEIAAAGADNEEGAG